MASDPDQRSAHYFDDEPEVASARKRIEVTLPDGSFTMETDTGVFSHGRVDVGTKFLLLEAPELPERGDLLDLGCGSGPIALTMARRRPDCRVWAVDVNARARRLTHDNAVALGLSNVTVASPDEFAAALGRAAGVATVPQRDRWLVRASDATILADALEATKRPVNSKLRIEVDPARI